MNELELKRKRIETIVKVLAIGLIGFFVAPFIFIAIKGIIGLAVAAAIALFGVNVFAPWFGSKIANWRLKAIKHEASLNPIETLENKYAEKQNALLEMRENLKEFMSAVQTLYSEIQEHNRNFPNRPSSFQDKYLKMKDLLDLRGKKYKDAQRNLERFADVIEEKRSDWKVAQAAAKANKLANVGEDFMSKLQTDTALTAVQDSLNIAFSELEVSLLDEQSTVQPQSTIVITDSPRSVAQITMSEPPTLDIEFNVEEKEHAPARPSARSRKS